MLLVLDQFEQWLHAKRGEENTELVAALRQCDGEHVQAVVLVRDDFWMAATRFMDDLEIELLQGQNTAAVDLFDPRHARKVLTAFGTAYGNLPGADGRHLQGPGRLSGSSDHRACPGRQGHLGAARLVCRDGEGQALDPGRPCGRSAAPRAWASRSWRRRSVPPQANPKHRLHQKAAQAVLKALLPETGTDIKGQMRSEAGIAGGIRLYRPPPDFADLIHILDSELRLITPTDPEGSSAMVR